MHSGSDESLVEVDVDGGLQRIEGEHVATDLSPRYRRSFKRMLITGSTPERSVEAEFDNERAVTRGRGVVLRVWSHDREDAVAVRDKLAVAIDGGRPWHGDAPKKGPPSEEPLDTALLKAERNYRFEVASTGFAAGGVVFFAAGILHRVVDPTSDIGQILFFCLCGDRKIAVGLYLVVLALAIFVAAPTLFPQIEISDRSTWSRARAGLFSVVGASIGFGGLLEVLSQALP